MKNNFKFQISNFKFLNKPFIFLIIIIILAAVLRFYQISTNPPGLYWDEAVIGYDAYSILKTAKDHHGVTLPLFFESFGDWKLPVYHYLLVPPIAVFGLNEFAVRFPSAFLGTLTVLITYFLVKKLFSQSSVISSQLSVVSSRLIGNRSISDRKQKTDKPEAENRKLKTDSRQTEAIALLSAFFLAISPWHIQFSRAGFEATVGLFFLTLGLFLFLIALANNRYFIFSFLSFIFSIYSYHAYRIFTPLLIIAVTLIYLRQIKKIIFQLIIPIIFSVVLLAPILRFTFQEEGRARAISQSAFKKIEVETAKIDFDQKSKKPFRFLSKYLYNQPIYYAYIGLNSYLVHFSPVFLFFKGDSVGRHSQVDMGQIYLFEALLLLIAVFAFKNLQDNIKKLMLAWLLLAPIAAILVTGTPHALRSLQMALPLAFFSGLGAYYFLMRGMFIVKALISLIIIYSFFSYLHLLFVHYPKKFAADWQDGYRQMVQEVVKYQDNFDKVYITNINQVPYIYLLFYQKYDSQKFILERGNRDAFSKYVFISTDADIYSQGRLLYVAPSWQKVDGLWLAAANDSDGRHIYSLWEIGGQN